MKKKETISLVAVMAVTLIGFNLIKWAVAGNLDTAAGPGDQASAMYTLENIYNRLTNNTTASKRSGGFAEPIAAPSATGHSLDDIYKVALPTQVAKSGQTVSVRTGDDGELQKGVPWPTTRFTDNSDGTVTDNLTGLVWLKDANCAAPTHQYPHDGTLEWNLAVTYVKDLYDGCTNCLGTTGDCSLSDGSLAGDWRLPNINELLSLIDYGNNAPALASGHPFINVQAPAYVSSLPDGGYAASTSRNGVVADKWTMDMRAGQAFFYDNHKPLFVTSFWVWPVRDAK